TAARSPAAELDAPSTEELSHATAEDSPETAEPAPATEEPSPATEEPAPPLPTSRRNASAIAALVFAILGLIGLLPLIGSVLAVILGRVGMREAARGLDAPPGAVATRGGRGMAIAAFIIGVLTLTVIAVATASLAVWAYLA
ncbi:MAG: DUF4190 domain-containing protein, partial [bacterium]